MTLYWRTSISGFLTLTASIAQIQLSPKITVLLYQRGIRNVCIITFSLEEDTLKVNALYPNHEVEMSSSVDGPWSTVENNTATVQLTGQTIYLRSV